ncbi:molybdopterin-guanine dinucleotide biosynthesis protein B [Longimicrobium sp.]|uniref:molybdopterin-guanine dinucleotide biosynthesis protein B n=1 Tax=Longimicrobium sp. TaxID=2029185 RepID=UPI002E2EE44D|nr:molybdopterin-guanine dinucleotide biosynthesis protein B [Longimicrobium sp.]HEX6041799.1 molybdopterin-guanine dinucleotide biosynthesis protein B [Longimicrobium sp.]
MSQPSPIVRPLPPLGVILAGGASRRFGAPKALAVVGGRRIVDRVLDALAAAVPEVVVSANDAALYDDLDLTVVPDRYADIGPLAGIHVGLLHAVDRGWPGALVVACDLPYVTADVLRLVVRRASVSPAEAIVPESHGRHGTEPLCAFYSVECIPVVEAMLAEGERRAHTLLERVRTDRVPLADIQAVGDPRLLFHNVNTVSDLDEGERRTGPLPPVVSVIGRKNSGKTRLMVALLREMRRRGFRVASIKHGHHAFEADEKGRDSWRHFNEGQAEATLMAGEGKIALVMRMEGEPDPERLVRDFLAGRGYDLVLVEGYKRGPFPKIEIWRRAVHDHPLYEEFSDGADQYLAIVTDDDRFRADVPVVLLDEDDTPSHIDRLGGMLQNLVLGQRGRAG